MQNAADPKAESPLSARPDQSTPTAPFDKAADPVAGQGRPVEIGGPEGPEPTRFGDWEKKGRCIDF
jgi:hypothetical protein